MNTFIKKLSYLWDYYKLYIIGIPLALLFLAYVISVFTVSKTDPFSVYFINQDVAIEDWAELEAQLLSELELTGENRDVYVDASLLINPDAPDADSQMTFTTAISGHTIDVMISDRAFLEHYAKMEAFAHLGEMLPPDLYDLMMPYLILAENEAGVMIPYGIDLSDFSYFADLKLDAPVLTIAKYSEHQADCIAFLFLLLSE